MPIPTFSGLDPFNMNHLERNLEQRSRSIGRTIALVTCVVSFFGLLGTVLVYGVVLYVADRALDSVEKAVDNHVITERAAPRHDSKLP